MHVAWNTTLISDLAQLDFSCFFYIIADLFNSSFPVKIIKITYSNKNPWITRKLKDEIIKREKLHARSKKTLTEANILGYKEYKNKNLTTQRIAERDYFRKQFDLQSRDMGKTFKLIRTLIDKDAGINVCKTVDFILDNRLVCDYNVISNTFNEYFISICSILASSTHCNVSCESRRAGAYAPLEMLKV